MLPCLLQKKQVRICSHSESLLHAELFLMISTL